ncbi:hypothetical protein [Chamaesiphon polymorphus]|uniref:hypothetical protein n=1 Tax=Chamaesiphon polymorphus TaxID=2107691 RepID=UPI0015E63D63|nr:hypothetical protein [Chamaesiphon polymorphus]
MPEYSEALTHFYPPIYPVARAEIPTLGTDLLGTFDNSRIHRLFQPRFKPLICHIWRNFWDWFCWSWFQDPIGNRSGSIDWR